jgi:hypothetical protein
MIHLLLVRAECLRCFFREKPPGSFPDGAERPVLNKLQGDLNEKMVQIR